METLFLVVFEEISKMFKSYYVVWKLEGEHSNSFRKQCLNRTMQYGNSFSQISRYFIVGGLNRTMQYGNTEDETRIEINKLV